MDTDQNSQANDTRIVYLELAANTARLGRRAEQRYARLLHDKGLDRKTIIDRLDIDEQTLDRMLAVDGRTMDPDCAQHKHRSCNGSTWDHINAFVRCQCECHARENGLHNQC